MSKFRVTVEFEGTVRGTNTYLVEASTAKEAVKSAELFLDKSDSYIVRDDTSEDWDNCVATEHESALEKT